MHLRGHAGTDIGHSAARRDWTENKRKGIWLKIPLSHAELVPAAAKARLRVSPRRADLRHDDALAAADGEQAAHTQHASGFRSRFSRMVSLLTGNSLSFVQPIA